MPETSQHLSVSRKTPPAINIIDNNGFAAHSKSTVDDPIDLNQPQAFCLRWNNYQTNLTTVFTQLLQDEQFVDVTLSCDGYAVKAHKMVLSACSPYFQSIFNENPCQHPIVIMRDIRWTELQPIVEFMYKGEINVSQDQIEPLLKVAQLLKVRGLADVNGGGGDGTTNDDASSKIDETVMPKYELESETLKRDREPGEPVKDVSSTIKRSRVSSKDWDNDSVYDLLATPPSSSDKKQKWSAGLRDEKLLNVHRDSFDRRRASTPPISVASDSGETSDGDSRIKDVIESVAAGDLIIDEERVSKLCIVIDFLSFVQSCRGVTN